MEPRKRPAALWASIQWHLGSQVVQRLWQIYFLLGLRLPPWLHQAYTWHYRNRLLRTYIARAACPSRIIIFRRKNLPELWQSSWSQLAGEGVELHEDCAEGHMDLFEEPTVQIWIEHLRTALEQAESEMTGKKPSMTSTL